RSLASLQILLLSSSAQPWHLSSLSPRFRRPSIPPSEPGRLSSYNESCPGLDYAQAASDVLCRPPLLPMCAGPATSKTSNVWSSSAACPPRYVLRLADNSITICEGDRSRNRENHVDKRRRPNNSPSSVRVSMMPSLK